MVGAILTFALLDTAGKSMRHASATQNEVYANTIIRQLLEATKATDYQDLDSIKGQHILLTNRISAGEIGPNMRPDPLQIDAVNKIWNSVTQDGRFRGDVSYTIADGPENGTLRITASVSWIDSRRYNNSNKRTVSSSIVVAREGVNAVL